MARYRIRVYADDYPDDPRAWDNVGTMACWHGRYSLGDEQPKVSPSEYTYALARAVDDTLPEWDDATDADVQRGREVFDAQYLHLPLYLYDHSGLTMRTTPFSCPWDSGQVGFIYVSRAKAAIEEAEPFEKKSLKTGVTEEVDEWRDYDSCGGFYGSDPEKNGMLDHVEAFARDALKSAAYNIGKWIEFEVAENTKEAA